MLAKHEEKLQEIRTYVENLCQNSMVALEKTIKGLEEKDLSCFKEAKADTSISYVAANKIDNEIITSLALFGAEASDLRELIAYLKITNEMVKVSDYIRGFSKKIPSLISYDSNISYTELLQLANCSLKSLAYAKQSIGARNSELLHGLYTEVQVEASKIEDIYSIMQKETLGDFYVTKEYSPEYVNLLSTTTRKLEKISDRAINVVKLMLFACVGGKLELY